MELQAEKTMLAEAVLKEDVDGVFKVNRLTAGDLIRLFNVRPQAPRVAVAVAGSMAATANPIAAADDPAITADDAAATTPLSVDPLATAGPARWGAQPTMPLPPIAAAAFAAEAKPAPAPPVGRGTALEVALQEAMASVESALGRRSTSPEATAATDVTAVAPSSSVSTLERLRLAAEKISNAVLRVTQTRLPSRGQAD